ncbi:MAG: universal stress protein [Acidobacteria bacterium]|nr:universal stress protein [Acidobacteriota bacterium]MBI3427199.1 universal stress protein [Acidobacteriota bacterium]
MKILLATDGSKSSEAAVQNIAARPWPAGSAVKILAVVEMHLTPTPGSWLVPDSHYLKLLHELQERARVAIEQAEAVLQATPLQVSSDIVIGNAKSTILKQAEDWAADLIVLGSHGHGVLERVLIGSVSQAILAQAHCSVEIIR